MNSKIILGAVLALVVVTGLIMYRAAPMNRAPEIATSTNTGGGVACTMEAKICPDGSAVGRTGPNCAFAECPTPQATGTTPRAGDTITVTARIGQSVTALGETITPLEVLDDSRCPIDVQCIWAGTVHLRATVKGGMGTASITFELGKSITTEVNTITLDNVEPAKDSKTGITTGDYRFTFKVVRR